MYAFLFVFNSNHITLPLFVFDILTT